MHLTPVRIADAQVTTGEAIEVRNSYGGAIVGQVPLCGPEQVDEACRAAAGALAHDDFPQHQRARVLEVAAALLRDRVEDFARTLMTESAKPIRTARVEATRCVDTLTFAAVEAGAWPGRWSLTRRSPATTSSCVPCASPSASSPRSPPSTFPLNLVAHKLVPAIAAGCPVVLKPAPQTPLSGITLVELLVEAGMPDDWVSVVTDRGNPARADQRGSDLPRGPAAVWRRARRW
jgi:acyl-CoA reductase-like NAD-dependent aldehyde dehydrogenase